MLVPISGADRIDGAFATRAFGTQEVIWIFFAKRFSPGKPETANAVILADFDQKPDLCRACGYCLRHPIQAWTGWHQGKGVAFIQSVA
jgi:hypothetical protein